MGTYVRNEVWAPDWLENFHCLMRNCPKTCCQNWNIDVDPVHAQQLLALEDPEMSPKIHAMLREIRLRRASHANREICYRFDLLSQPGNHCPLLDPYGECSLQKRYGEDILCHTCYFYPRLFWQIDDRWTYTTGLACPETARLAVIREDPVRFVRFVTETDPDAEWLETEQLYSEDLRDLLRSREDWVLRLTAVLQNRALPIETRLELACQELWPREEPYAVPTDAAGMERLSAIFDRGCAGRERASESARDLFRTLAGGPSGYFGLLAENYCRNFEANYRPFLETHPTYEENFLVHYVFSDLFKQFGRYRRDAVSAAEIRTHEASLLAAVFGLFRLNQCARPGPVDESGFLDGVIRSDDAFFHYPDWVHFGV